MLMDINLDTVSSACRQGIENRAGLTVVEAAGIPHPVVAAAAPVEVHGLGPVKHVDAVVAVLAGVAVHNVHEHQQAQPVRLINQGLELVRRAKPAAGLQAVVIKP